MSLCFRPLAGTRGHAGAGRAQRRGKRGHAAEARGDADGGIWTAGQVVGLIDDIPTCAEVMARMVKEAEETIRGRMNGLLTSRL